jgi:YfiH family protein
MAPQIEFTEHENGVRWAFFAALKQQGLTHGISTRLGGISTGGLATLNLGVKVNDLEQNLQINRQRFCEAVGVDIQRVVSSGQVHETAVAIVDNSHAGKRIAETDALVTNTRGLPLLLFFADCVPLLIFDPVRQVIGLSHAGWKGTEKSIGPKTLQCMQHNFGTEPADCLVGIAPSIGPTDYEVDEPVMAEIRKHWDNEQRFSRPTTPGHWQLDLWQWNQIQFESAGVNPANIHIAGISTAKQPELFFSHRASQGSAGRFGVLMSL